MKTRKEFDSIGGISVPNDKYWGASTQRSMKFFNIGKINVPTSIIRSIAIIKRSAAIVHKKDKLNKRLLPIEVIEGNLEYDIISIEKDEIGKVLINDNYPYALIKVKNEKLDFGKTFNCGSAKVKIKKPDWLQIT